MRLNYIIIFVSDMARSVAFYRDVLGIPLKFESPEWTEFATEGATLALHKSEGTGVNNARHPEPSRPGFQVPNLEEFHSQMIKKKVPCIQEPTEIFGARVAQYADPDGLIFSVGQQQSGN